MTVRRVYAEPLRSVGAVQSGTLRAVKTRVCWTIDDVRKAIAASNSQGRIVTVPRWARDRLDDERTMGDFEPEGAGPARVALSTVAWLAVALVAVGLSLAWTVGLLGAVLEWWS